MKPTVPNVISEEDYHFCQKQMRSIPEEIKTSQFMQVWKKNFVLAECIYVFSKDAKIEDAIAYFRPAGGFTHFCVRKPLNEIFTELSPAQESIFNPRGS